MEENKRLTEAAERATDEVAASPSAPDTADNKNIASPTDPDIVENEAIISPAAPDTADDKATISPNTECDIVENKRDVSTKSDTPSIESTHSDASRKGIGEEESNASSEDTPKRDNRRGGPVRRLVSLAAFVALALILSFIESRIPTFVAIPGVKIGLANIVVVFCLYRMRPADAVVVSLVRVALSSLLFGSLTSFLYGLGGATVSLALMIVLKRLNFGSIAVSTVGGVSHNIAQIAVASILLGTNVVGYYLPFLVLAGTIAGIVVGVAGGILEKKIPKW